MVFWKFLNYTLSVDFGIKHYSFIVLLTLKKQKSRFVFEPAFIIYKIENIIHHSLKPKTLQLSWHASSGFS